jgi:RNA polymerase sigma factor (sigma-70 family)
MASAATSQTRSASGPPRRVAAAVRDRVALNAGQERSRRFTLAPHDAYHRGSTRAEHGGRMAGDSLAEAFTANRAALLRYLRARGAGDEADDLLQDLWLKLGGGSDVAVLDPLAYLYRMAHNLMLDRRRATVRRQRREEHYLGEGAGEADDAPAAERVLIARERLRHVDRALAALGARTDFIFRRYRVEGVAQRDIAAELGITLSAVEKHLKKAYRAVAAAQTALQAEDDASVPDVAREPVK